MQHNIQFAGPVLPGSVSVASGRCGKRVCACKGKQPRLHGPYYRWTGYLNGKRTTITLSKEEAEECSRRIRNFRSLKRKIEKLVSAAMSTAPWLASD